MTYYEGNFCMTCGNKINDVYIQCPSCKNDITGMYIIFRHNISNSFCPKCGTNISKEWFLKEFSEKERKSFWKELRDYLGRL